MFWYKKNFFLHTYVRLNSPPVRNPPHLAWPLSSPFRRTYYVDDPYSDMS